MYIVKRKNSSIKRKNKFPPLNYIIHTGVYQTLLNNNLSAHEKSQLYSRTQMLNKK